LSTEPVLIGAKCAWRTGVRSCVNQTGGLLTDDSLLMKVATCVQENIPHVTGLEE